MRTKRSQYQQGSIRKVRKAKGYVWEVRFSEWLNGKRFQRTMRFQGTAYPKETDVRKAIELTVSQINSGTAGEKADAKFGAIITLYRRKFLPSESRLLELRKKLHKVFPAHGALVDAFTVSREDEIDEINLMLKAAATAENINLLAQRLTVPNAPELEFSTRQHHAYLLDHYIEPRFANVPIREMKVLMIDEWLLSLRGTKGRPLAGTTKASIRTLLSKCFKLAAKHEFISQFEHNPMHLIEVSGSMLLQKGLKPIAAKHGVPGLTWHALRHACRSWLSSGGATLTTQKGLLRHADESTTSDVYGYPMTDDMRKAHDQLVSQMLKE